MLAALLTTPVGRRLHLVEIHDLDSCPSEVRRGLTDGLVALWGVRLDGRARGSLADAAARVVAGVVAQTRATQVVDVCSGSGGPFKYLCESAELAGVQRFTLTDLFPNVDAYRRLEARSKGKVRFVAEAVDATRLPAGLANDPQIVRTLFASFHHLPRPIAVSVLRDAVRAKQAIAVFEPQNRSPACLAIFLTAIPVGAFLAGVASTAARATKAHSLAEEPPSALAVFLRGVMRLTVVPVVTTLDGLVSCLRTYSRDEFMELAREADPDGAFSWSVTATPVHMGGFWALTSYVGVPRELVARFAAAGQVSPQVARM